MSNPAHDNNMITVTLPDGSKREYTTGTTGGDIAYSIGERLGKAALAVKVNDKIIDLNRPITGDADVAIITLKSDEGLELIRHDAAHVMAEAVQELFPGTQVTIGPAIENGFYYDFAREQPFTDSDFEAIENKMREIIKRDEPFTREEWSREDAIKFFKDKGEEFKVELIQDLPKDEILSIYKQGEWTDLCRGPHLPSTGKVGTAFKLMKVAGAYWRGDSNRPMLQRIYGTVWRDKKELDAYLHLLEEAEKRDHRRLGQELELFHLQEEAAGSVFWHPKGWTLYRQVENYVRNQISAAGYVEVKTPQLIDRKLWEKSGHWDKFRKNMFIIKDSDNSELEDHESTCSCGCHGAKDKNEDNVRYLAVKPMNCPAHVQIFKQGTKSYRDLPLRMAEFGCCHRNEPSGALHGIMRVRQMVQDDAHIFCSEDQIISETKEFCALLLKMYKDFGFENVGVKIATRPELRAGTDETWDKAEKGLIEATEATGLSFDLAEGEGAFYGPKIEFHLTDAIGRTWQCGTLQLDFVLPERLDAEYTGEDGNKHRPVMLHRAILGSLERFIGILIEHYAGAFPVWLAPVQAVVATITNEFDDYGQQVVDTLKKHGIRVESDLRSEKITYKVREHSLKKVPYILAVGGKEKETNSVAVRTFGSEGQKVMGLDEFIAMITDQAKMPA